MTLASLEQRLYGSRGAFAVSSLVAMLGTAAPATSAEPVSAKAHTAIACTSLTALEVPGFEVSIKQAAVVPPGPVATSPFEAAVKGPLPAYCRADGVIDERVGYDGKPYAIGFAVAMPENWNGRFLMQGGGGLNGNVALPLGGVAAGDTPGLARGFAVVTTDTGHKGAVFDTSFLADQEAALNFLYQAVGKVAQVVPPVESVQTVGLVRLPT